jgi:hypothetical protein
MLVWFWYGSSVALASHNLAGQITYRRIGTNTYEITLTTYTDSAAAGVDRCTADIEIWGIQGNNRVFITLLRDIPRSNGPVVVSCDLPARNGTQLRARVKKNNYTVIYRFNGPGLFDLRYRDIARINNVRNMANSGATAFYVETRLNNNPFTGVNNSVVLLNEPIDDACTGQLWTHNPGGYDPDGDSLVYSLINCQQYDPPNFNTPVSVANFQFPNAFGGGFFTIDRQTGLVSWGGNPPKETGRYNIAIKVEEYRNSRLIGYVIRDMAIFVKPCQNRPPVIDAPEEVCVQVGSTIEFRVRSWDPDSIFKPAPLPPPNFPDSLYFYLNNGDQGANGPFQVVNNPPTLIDSTTGLPLDPARLPLRRLMPQPLTLDFAWETTCEHLKKGFYQLDFYAHDNYHLPGFPRQEHPTLAANKIVKIYVTPRAVDGLTTTPGSRQITVSWNRNFCPNAIGYDVYRSTGSGITDTTDCCKTPKAPRGFKKIARLEGWDNTSFVDNENGRGLAFRNKYCYTIVTVFPNDVFSCPSDTSCVQIIRDMPVITNDSIITTDAANGQLLVAWQKPEPARIDTNFFPRPYSFDLARTEGFTTGGNYTTIVTNLPETQERFLDTGLNTEANPYSYRVTMKASNGATVGVSDPASSVFITLIPGDNKIRVSWEYDVPWTNTRYEIFRSIGRGTAFVKIGDTTLSGNIGTSYFDDRGRDLPTGLQRDQEYCYFVRTTGSYSSSGIRSPLINDSQIACGIPLDVIPPCLPDTTAFNFAPDCQNLTLRFAWTPPDSVCGDDAAYYSIYFSRDTISRRLIYQTPDPTTLQYVLQAPSIAGCYELTVTDRSGNESEPSPRYCFDNCPLLFLPNVYVVGSSLPLAPTFVRSIGKFEFFLFDRWGIQVARSTDPLRLWDGQINGSPAIPGHYYWLMRGELDNLPRTPFERTGGLTVLRR